MVKANRPFTIPIMIKKYTSHTISIREVLNALKIKGYDFSGSIICLYSRSLLLCCGNFEEVSRIVVPMKDVEQYLCIDYKLITHKKLSKHMKERTIREVVAIVYEWRRFYVGRMMADGKVEKYSVEEAARIIGVPKKTLDDYFFQIQIGRQNGFDFNKHSEANIGFLRSFVQLHKKHKKKVIKL